MHIYSNDITALITEQTKKYLGDKSFLTKNLEYKINCEITAENPFVQVEWTKILLR